MTRRPTDLAVPIIGAAVGGATLILLPAQIPGASLADVSEMRSPAFFPIVAATAVILASVADATRVLAGGGAKDAEPWRWRRPLGLALAFALYLLLVPLLGMMTSAFLLMVVMSRVFGYPRAGRVLVVALATTALIYVLFERVLLVLFPHGLIF
ncbi:MAG TPA: tripartite tricarboxylate transporter TctB family protein [Methylomirabilota bacterium]|nr:tripartite tricarboxylate transporter TctB family protein [Methylomirabilota bacterium]